MIQFSSVTQSCPTLCDPINCSMLGFPVHHQLPEFIQTHVHWVSDAIQLSHPLLFLSSAFSLSQHQGLFFASSGQSIGALAWASVLSMNIQGWFPLGLTGLISLKSKGLLRVFSNTTVQKYQFFIVQVAHPYMTAGKTIALTRWTCVGKVMSLLFNMLSRLVITFLPRSKRLLISWLQSPSAVIWEKSHREGHKHCMISLIGVI